MESRFTPVGRGRSHYYTAFVRSQVEEKTWGRENISRINSTSIPAWPRGQRPYSYGYFLMHELGELANNSGSKDSIYSVLNHRYGRRFPWFLNAPVEEYFGMDYSSLLSKTYDSLEAKAQTQLQTLQNGKAQNGQLLPQDGYFNFGAQISPDKLKMAAIVSQVNDDPSIRIWTRGSTKEPFTLKQDIPKPLTNNKNIHQLSWRSDSVHLIYDHSDTWEHFNQYSDLYEINYQTEDEKRLTYGKRAREATVLNDGTLVYVSVSSTNTKLMHAQKDGENPQDLYSPPFGHRVSSPRPYQDGVIYSHRDDKGREWIEAVSLTTKKIRKLTSVEKTGQMHVTPIADPQVPKGFYFAGSDTGVMNIYRGDESKWKAITNVTTYITAPTIDVENQQVIYSRLTAEGFKLEAGSLIGNSNPAAIGPLQKYPDADENHAAPAKIIDDDKYNGLSYLFPQYWIPFVYFVPGGAIFDISTSGSDPLNHHQYSIGAGYDTRPGQGRQEFIYSNSSLGFFIDTGFANDHVYLAGANTTQHVMSGSLSTRHFLLPNSNKWMIGPSVTYKQTNYYNLLFTEFGPGIDLYYNNISAAKDYQISPESGEKFSIGYDYYLPGWGNTAYPNVHGTGSLFLAGGFLPEHHVVFLKAAAWISPEHNTILVGHQQAGGEYAGTLFSSPYMVRGYPVGEFIGSTIYTGTFEYRFPLSYQYTGSDTFPLFINKWHGALLADAATLHGGYYDDNFTPGRLMATKLGTFYMGSGAEVRADTTLFYGVPVTFRFGVYYGHTEKAFGGVSYFIGLGSVQ